MRKHYYPITTHDQIIIPDSTRWNSNAADTETMNDALSQLSQQIEKLGACGLKSDPNEDGMKQTISSVPISWRYDVADDRGYALSYRCSLYHKTEDGMVRALRDNFVYDAVILPGSWEIVA